MKLVTSLENGHPRHGVVVGSVILDVTCALVALAREAGDAAATEATIAATHGADMLGLIAHQDVVLPKLKQAIARAEKNDLVAHVDGQPLTKPLAGAKLLAPIPRPPSMRDGYAFRQHVQTARKNRGLDMIPEFDQFPVFYFTNHQAVVGPGDLAVMPLHLEKLDFELEAAIVVGRQGRNLAAKDADAHVFGLMIMNDFSARVLQMEEMKLSLGPAKGKDFATGLGPYLVTLDELASHVVPTPHGNKYDLRMTAHVNGKQVSEGNVKDMDWTFAQILERASYGVTLHPGDVIGSGTCGTGCFLELNGSKITDNQWLLPGDVITLEIAELGKLENKIVEEK